MKRTSFDSMPCPLARAMEHLSDSWNGLILREAFYGSTRFDQFESRLGIATNTLTRRLKGLVDGEILERRRYSAKPPRFEYLLTPKGRDLRPVLLSLLDWANKYAYVPGTSVQLVDTLTGKPVKLELIDAVTRQPIGTQHRVLLRTASRQSSVSYPFPNPAHH